MAASAHDSAPQPHHLIPNNDPALNTSNEHQHTHLHHDSNGAKGHHDDTVVYSTGTTDGKSTIPHPDEQDQHLARRGHAEVTKASPGTMGSVTDAEKAGSGSEEYDPQTHTASSFYRRYRIFFHLFFWLVMTGSVCSPFPCSLCKRRQGAGNSC